LTKKDNSTNWKKPILITAILCLIFSGSGWALKAIPSARNLPERMAFESFPMQIGQWQGNRHYISKEILDQLWSDDYISATYSRPNSANHINLLIPFYEYQGTRHTAHAPQACMLGSGWALFNSSERQIDLNPHGKINIMTMTWEKGNYKLLGSYFFFQRGRVITSPWTNKFYLMWDAFTKRRTDGAVVRAEMIVAPGQTMDDAYEVLEGFIAELWPILPEYVPN
jgi:EpsI family protein